MRVNRETLLKIARDTAAQRSRTDRDIVSVYLVGSLLEEEYLLGGTADIDLVFVHASRPTVEREVTRLSDDVHLDIAHHTQAQYRQPRNLRSHPWLGSGIYHSPMLPGDSQHWLEFTQASVRAQFNRPDATLERARYFYEQARTAWQEMRGEPTEKPAHILEYLKALADAGNAVAVLAGSPLTERRFLQYFPARTEAAGYPGLNAGLTGLVGAHHMKAEDFPSLIDRWEAAFAAAGALAGSPPSLHPARLGYYRRGAEELLRLGLPAAALWSILHTFTLAVAHLPQDCAETKTWQEAATALHLAGEFFPERLSGLDLFLDSIEEALETYAKDNGIS